MGDGEPVLGGLRLGKRSWAQFLLVLAILLILQWISVRSLLYTAGHGGQFLAACLAVFAGVIGLLAMFLRKQSAAVRIIGLTGTLVLGTSLWLGHVWVRLHLEAGRVVAFAYEEKQRSGSFPDDLSGYSFRDPLLRDRLQVYRSWDDGFRVMFYVATPSVSYWYDAPEGWKYYPD